MEQIRSFIAIELPENVKVHLAQLENNLKKDCKYNIKWVNPDNLHLTLKFLGNIETNKVELIVQTIRDTLVGDRPFILNLDNLGVFPDLKNIHVIWIGLGGELDTLKIIQSKIESNLVPLGFIIEKRPFTAHLTLARVAENASYEDRQILARSISKIELEKNISFNVNSISLMKSQLARTGPTYTRLSLIEIKSPCQ
jgi:RNA 2',3'-cyclic 3'-phosphodiesterase